MKFFRSIFSFGFVTRWMESGMDDDVIGKFHRILALKRGNLERMLSRCEESI